MFLVNSFKKITGASLLALARYILILGISQADDRESQWIEAGYVVGSKMLVSSFQTTKFNIIDIQRFPGAAFLAHWALHSWPGVLFDFNI